EKSPGCLSWLVMKVMSVSTNFLSNIFEKQKKYIEELRTKAKVATRQEGIKQYICPFLQNVENEPYEIARVMVSKLLPPVLAKSIVLSLEPDLFAMMAIIIAQNGVESYCAERINYRIK